MNEIADIYMNLGAAGFVCVSFGFVLYNLIQENKAQSEDLEEIKQSIHKMEAVLDNSVSINVKLIDRMNSSDKDREVFWRELSDDLAFIKGRINGGSK
ncbi:PREDICTED: pleckstrin homology domain-containing family A member 7 [uncultured Mediterranean phage uvMED]|nr:PREDICTED: pleckstrin homology domain-containing family A member 7 [uncultured Mediterranean phage uvMED]